MADDEGIAGGNGAPFAELLGGVLLAMGVAALWVVLGFVNAGTNYHFAPLVATLAPIVVVRLRRGRLVEWRTTVAAIIAGVMASTFGALMLLALVAFDGPTLAPGLTPESEAIMMVAIGVAAGLLIARAGRAYATPPLG